MIYLFWLLQELDIKSYSNFFKILDVNTKCDKSNSVEPKPGCYFALRFVFQFQSESTRESVVSGAERIFRDAQMYVMTGTPTLQLRERERRYLVCFNDGLH